MDALWYVGCIKRNFHLYPLVVFLTNMAVPSFGAVIMRDAWNFFSGKKTSEKVATYEIRDIRRLIEVGEMKLVQLASTAC